MWGCEVRYGLAERELQRLLKTLLMQYRQDADREETTNSEDKLSCGPDTDTLLACMLARFIASSLSLPQTHSPSRSLLLFLLHRLRPHSFLARPPPPPRSPPLSLHNSLRLSLACAPVHLSPSACYFVKLIWARGGGAGT